MGFLDEIKIIADDLKDDFNDSNDPYDRLEMRVAAFVIGFIVLLVIIGVLVLLAKLVLYLVPILIIAGLVYWFVFRDRNDKSESDFRKK